MVRRRGDYGRTRNLRCMICLSRMQCRYPEDYDIVLGGRTQQGSKNVLRTGLDLDLNSFWKCKQSIILNVLINDIKVHTLTCFRLKMSGGAPFCSNTPMQLQMNLTCSARDRHAIPGSWPSPITNSLSVTSRHGGGRGQIGAFSDKLRHVRTLSHMRLIQQSFQGYSLASSSSAIARPPHEFLARNVPSRFPSIPSSTIACRSMTPASAPFEKNSQRP